MRKYALKQFDQKIVENSECINEFFPTNIHVIYSTYSYESGDPL